MVINESADAQTHQHSIIFHLTLSFECSSVKIYEFRFVFCWSLFPGVQLTIIPTLVQITAWLLESALGHAKDKVHGERDPYVGLIFMDMIYLYAFGNNSLNRCFIMLRECASNFSYVIQKIVTGTMQHEPLPNQASLISMTHTTHICPDHDTLKSPVHLASLLLSQ